jgi:hypothetical protein
VNNLAFFTASGRPGAAFPGHFSKFFTVSLAVLLSTAGMLASGIAGEKAETEFPSPDGKFAFRESFGADHTTLDLVERSSGSLVCHVLDSSDNGPRLKDDVLWAPDSKSFALSSSEARLSWSVSVFVREGGTFREVELPSLTDPEIPAKYENDGRLHHWSAIGVWKPVRWQKDGSLEIRGETTRDGNDNWVTSERTVVFAPDKAGKWRIVRSKNKVASHFE